MAVQSFTLFSFIDEQTDEIIAITGAVKHIAQISGGAGATISVDCIVILWGAKYTVSDILIDTLDNSIYFDPADYDGLALGKAFDYSISVRLMVNAVLN